MMTCKRRRHMSIIRLIGFPPARTGTDRGCDSGTGVLPVALIRGIFILCFPGISFSVSAAMSDRIGSQVRGSMLAPVSILTVPPVLSERLPRRAIEEHQPDAPFELAE
jgi:hypothetical protein